MQKLPWCNGDPPIYCLERRESDIADGSGWLSERERAVLDGLRVPKRRADWRLGRWTAKCAMAAYLELEEDPATLASIEIRAAASGAPKAFRRGWPAGPHISLSHSHGAGFCAVAAGTPIGCDVERIEARSEAFFSDYFTAREQALAAGTANKNRDCLLTLLWSGKESVMKVLECGLRADTRRVTVIPTTPLPPDDGWHTFGADAEAGHFTGWWRQAGGWMWTIAIPLAVR